MRRDDHKSQEHPILGSAPADWLATALQSAPARHWVAKHNLSPDHIAATTQYLQSQSILPDLVAIQLSQQLIQIYGPELDEKITSEVILIHIKNLVKEIFETNNTWSNISQEIWSNLIAHAIQDMQRDLGELVLESLDWAGFNEVLFQYLFNQTTVVIDRISHLEGFYAQTIAAEIVQELDLTNQPLSALNKLLKLIPDSTKPNPVNQDRWSQKQIVEEIPSELPIMSTIPVQLQTDLWQSNVRGVAYARYHARQNHSNYLEYYITSSGDIQAFPWEIAEQIMNRLGFNAVKLQILLAAHAAKQVNPWESTFTLKAGDMITELGWDKNPHLDLPTARNQVAGVVYALSSLLIKAVWSESQGEQPLDISTPIGSVWEVLLHPHGQLDLQTGKIERPNEVYITVRPGLWTAYFLNQAGSEAKETLLQFSNQALNLLQIDSEDELTLRLAIYLTLDARLQVSQPHPHEYQVKSLLAAVVPQAVMEQAQESSKNAWALFERWNHALKLLGELDWHPEENGSQSGLQADQTPVFYVKPCPRWLEPESNFRKPRGWVDCWLEQRLIIKPPSLELERSTTLNHLGQSQQKFKLQTPSLTGSEVRAARQASKLTQTELAERLQVHQSLIARIESGDRTLTPSLETSLRQVLGLGLDSYL